MSQKSVYEKALARGTSHARNILGGGECAGMGTVASLSKRNPRSCERIPEILQFGSIFAAGGTSETPEHCWSHRKKPCASVLTDSHRQSHGPRGPRLATRAERTR